MSEIQLALRPLAALQLALLRISARRGNGDHPIHDDDVRELYSALDESGLSEHTVQELVDLYWSFAKYEHAGVAA